MSFKYDAMPRTGDTAANLHEPAFRWQVRDILNLSWDTRDDRILDELRRLKQAESKGEVR